LESPFGKVEKGERIEKKGLGCPKKKNLRSPVMKKIEESMGQFCKSGGSPGRKLG